MLDKVKIYLGIAASDTSKDALLNLLIDECEAFALDYCHLEEATEPLGEVIILMVLERYNKVGNEGVASANYGGISEEFMEDYSKGIYRRLKTFRKVRVVC